MAFLASKFRLGPVSCFCGCGNDASEFGFDREDIHDFGEEMAKRQKAAPRIMDAQDEHLVIKDITVAEPAYAADTAADDSAGARAEQQSGAQPQDLSGTWQSSGPPEGMDSFLSEIKGMNYVVRSGLMQVMKAFTAKLVVTVDGDEINIDSHSPKGVATLRFRPDGKSFQSKFGPDHEDGTGVACWEADTLVVRAQLKDMNLEIRRRLVGNGLEEQVIGKKGGKEATLRRVWARA